MFGHLLVCGPRHDLQEWAYLRMKVIQVDAGSHDVLELGVSAAGGKPVLRGQIARDEGAEGLTASEVVSGVDDLLLALEGVASGEIEGFVWQSLQPPTALAM